MRTEKAMKNVLVTLITYIISFLPVFIARRVFLDQLGTELLGLSSLYNNILSYLSVIEMGVGSAIIFSLYEPFEENNREKVKGYLDYYLKFYKIVGILVLLLGMIITPFLNIFIRDNINMFQAKLYFLLFLINTVISYFFSYKQCILNVAQEGYKLSIATTISKVVITLLQIVFLKIYSNFYIYLIIQILINFIYYILVNRYIDRRYLWINTIKGKIEKEEKKYLLKNIKALFMHKIGNIVVFGTDSLVISSFINLNNVSKYNSYSMIFTYLQTLISNCMNSLTPSIGNLLVSNDRKKAYMVHKRLFFISFWIISFIIITLWNTSSQFVNLWLGESQLLDSFTVALILINLYFQLMRSSVEKFKDGSGNYYQDRYAPAFEAVINLICSIILVNIIGLSGVFLGTFISNISVVFWVKPKITYKYVFEKPLIKYFIMYFKYLFLSIIPLVLTTLMLNNVKCVNSIWAFIVNCVINVVIINSVYLIIFWRNEEFIYFKDILLNKIKLYKK